MNRPDLEGDVLDLRGEPLRVKMFTPELAARIRARAAAEAARSTGANAAMARRTLYFGVMAGCLAVILLIAIRQDRLALPGPAVGDSSVAVEPGGPVSGAGGGLDAAETGSATGTAAQAETDPGGTAEGAASAGGDGSGHPAEAAEPEEAIGPAESGEAAESGDSAPADSRIQYTPWHKTPTLTVREPTGEEWQMLIDVSYPRERTEYRGEASYGAVRRVIFSSKMTKVGEALYGEVAVYEFEWEAVGWQRSARWGYTPSDNLKEAESGAITASAGFGPEDASIDLLAGFVLDPEIVRMRVTDDRGDVHEAQMYPETDGVRSWFVATPERPRGSYRIQGFDAEGNVRYETTAGWHSMKHRQPEEQAAEGVKS
jgi:hypothetical protein